MVGDDGRVPETTSQRHKRFQDVTILRKSGAPRQYVSKHFSQSKTGSRKRPSKDGGDNTLRPGHEELGPKVNGTLQEHGSENVNRSRRESEPSAQEGSRKSGKVTRHEFEDMAVVRTKRPRYQPQTQDDDVKPVQLSNTPIPRVFYGLNIDELSSDSDLTDVPDDMGPDPFEVVGSVPIKRRSRAKKDGPRGKNTETETETVQKEKKEKEKKEKEKKEKKEKREKKKPAQHPKISPYFGDILPRHKPRPHFLATLPFPPLSAERFGLMQERLATDPFRLLLATIFLNKTPGARAMPVMYKLIDRFPSPEALAGADVAEVSAMIHCLGFQNQRAAKCVALAKGWLAQPPRRGVRFRKLNYPSKGDGRDVKEGEAIGDADDRVAWEISHLPGLGPYSHDSWRMFCRDMLRGRASDWLGNGVRGEGQQDHGSGFEPEWKRALPTDKELRAWMTWMWLKEGWVWNKETGQRTKADKELMQMARGGGVVVEEREKESLTVKGLNEGYDYLPVVENPAGNFVPSTPHTA